VRPLILLPLLLLSCLSIACINTDAAVFVEPRIEKPEAEVSGGTLGIGLKGSFQLSLHLGARATGSSEVTPGTTTIFDAEKKEAIVSALLVKTETPFPVVVEVDSDVDIPFTFDSGTKPLPNDVKLELCDPAGLVLGGAITDSLQNRATPFASAVFHPVGCM
jgi:hypothetical protein